MLPDYDAPHYRNELANEKFPKHIIRTETGEGWASNQGPVVFIRQASVDAPVEMAHLDGTFEVLDWARNMDHAVEGLYRSLPCSALFAYAILRHKNGG